MIKVELTGQSRATLRSLEKRFPKTMRAAFGAAAKRARKRLVKVMRQAGGVYGVPAMPPHNEISTYLRPGQKMGGVLADECLGLLKAFFQQMRLEKGDSGNKGEFQGSPS